MLGMYDPAPLPTTAVGMRAQSQGVAWKAKNVRPMTMTAFDCTYKGQELLLQTSIYLQVFTNTSHTSYLANKYY